jgi:hypothetical protein
MSFGWLRVLWLIFLGRGKGLARTCWGSLESILGLGGGEGMPLLACWGLPLESFWGLGGRQGMSTGCLLREPCLGILGLWGGKRLGCFNSLLGFRRTRGLSTGCWLRGQGLGGSVFGFREGRREGERGCLPSRGRKLA